MVCAIALSIVGLLGPVTADAAPCRPDLVMTSLAMPLTLERGESFSIRFGVTNRGSAASTGSRLKIYLSTDTRLSAGDVLLRDHNIPPILAGGVHASRIGESIPTNVKAGSYYLLLLSDANGTMNESNEANNVKVVAVTVR